MNALQDLTSSLFRAKLCGKKVKTWGSMVNRGTSQKWPYTVPITIDLLTRTTFSYESLISVKLEMLLIPILDIFECITMPIYARKAILKTIY